MWQHIQKLENENEGVLGKQKQINRKIDTLLTSFNETKKVYEDLDLRRFNSLAKAALSHQTLHAEN